MQLVEALPPRSRVAAQIKEHFEAVHLQDVIAKVQLLVQRQQQLLFELQSPSRPSTRGGQMGSKE